MWTPKRMLLLVLAVALTLGCYLAYSRQLGAVDGLPPLPEAYLPLSDVPIVGTVRPVTLTEKKLELAFGPDAQEINKKQRIKVEAPARGLVLAAGDLRFLEDGRVSLAPLSVALFGKSVGAGGVPEINTLRGARAIFTFERPVRTLSDLGKYRIVAAEVAGDIRIANNRRTSDQDDDINVLIKKGPLHYDQKQQRIWTDDYVRLEDHQSKPKPTTISGLGMVLELDADKPEQPKASRAKQKTLDNISGVRTVHLHSTVRMDIWIESRSGFLGGGTESKTPTPPTPVKTTPEKSHLMITTNGPFRYDLLKDFAEFDKGPRTGNSQDDVLVQRELGPKGVDQLECAHLELQFRKKAEAANPPKPKQPGDRGTGLEIDTAHATGPNVTLTSDGESLNAHGTDFRYETRTATSTLKGSPMWAMKEGSLIQAPELCIQRTPTGQKARARGQGMLEMRDKTPGKKPIRARWNDELVSDREGEHEVLHLIGNAAFLDEENGQELRADDLKVWMMPQSPTPVDKAKPTPDLGKRGRRPHHLVGVGRVRSRSKEFNITDAQRFVVWFHDAPAAPVVPAAVAPAPMKPAVPPMPGAKPAPAEPRPPVNLRARTVEAHVLRVGDKSQLQKMRSEGAVHVHQAPTKPGETGVDIRGGTLQLNAFPEGNVLVVTGDGADRGEEDVARLVLNDMTILGPEVNVDQPANKAWVNGLGAMTLRSETDFQGNKMKKTSPLTVHWNRSMVFTGRQAVFQGGIVADQDNARLTCQELTVVFDQPISLREGRKDKDKAKVSSLVCDKSARLEDSAYEGGTLQKYQQLTGSAIAVDNEERTVQACGPGEFRALQRGDGPGVGPAPPKPGGPAKAKDDMKLTCVAFHARMNGFRNSNMAVFYTNVRVLHLPSEDPRMEVNFEKILEKLPPGAMYLRCDLLHVVSRPRPGGKASQEMKAEGRVVVHSNDFSGEAETVSYDEEKDQVIFDGGAGGTATLSKFGSSAGRRPQTIIGKRIIYSRRTGKHTGEGIKEILGGQ